MAAIPLVVADGKRENVLRDVLAGKDIGTCFAPRKERVDSRRQWIAFGRPPSGTLVVDAGARKALGESGKSLLPIGIREVRGTFAEGDTVSLLGPEGAEIARGLTNFTADEMIRIAGKRSSEIAALLGYDAAEEAVHRDNLVVL